MPQGLEARSTCKHTKVVNFCEKHPAIASVMEHAVQRVKMTGQPNKGMKTGQPNKGPKLRAALINAWKESSRLVPQQKEARRLRQKFERKQLAKAALEGQPANEK